MNKAEDLKKLKDLGYTIGRRRFRRCVEGTDMKTVGRKTKVHSKELEGVVRDVLQSQSRDSSKVSVVKTQEGKTMEPSRILTGSLSGISSQNPEIHSAMSESTFRRMKKKVFMEYRAPACESDYCQYCYDLDKKVLPGWQRTKDKAKQELGGHHALLFQLFRRIPGLV